MSESEWKAFLTEPVRTGKLATVRADGRPHVTPIWFVLDGDTLLFTTGRDTVKGKAILRVPRVALCVDDDQPPFTFVNIEGTVQISQNREELRHWAGVIGGRYMGPDRADEFGDRNGAPGELLVRLIPSRIVALTGVSD